MWAETTGSQSSRCSSWNSITCSFHAIILNIWDLTSSRAMSLVWMTEYDHMYSSFASAGSRKRRRSRNHHDSSMMTNSMTANLNMLLIFPYLLHGNTRLFTFWIAYLMHYRRTQIDTDKQTKLTPLSFFQSQPEAGPSRLAPPIDIDTVDASVPTTRY